MKPAMITKSYVNIVILNGANSSTAIFSDISGCVTSNDRMLSLELYILSAAHRMRINMKLIK
jgi:hypothetical protein